MDSSQHELAIFDILKTTLHYMSFDLIAVTHTLTVISSTINSSTGAQTYLVMWLENKTTTARCVSSSAIVNETILRGGGSMDACSLSAIPQGRSTFLNDSASFQLTCGNRNHEFDTQQISNKTSRGIYRSYQSDKNFTQRINWSHQYIQINIEVIKLFGKNN